MRITLITVKLIAFWGVLFICLNPAYGAKSSEQRAAVATISKVNYQQQLYGFWLGQCIANWTGLVTEMDKIGNIGEIKTGAFYTRNDWGRLDQPSIWGQGVPSDLSATINFVFEAPEGIWGSDDDTDIEYIYQYLLATEKNSVLTAEQIRRGWLTHIYSSAEKTPFGKDPDDNYENYLWVSNQRAYDLMAQGMLPPETSSPDNNEHFDMIDAQLTTEIFGLFAPARPDIALAMAYLPIRTTASGAAAEIAEFYVTMYSLGAGFAAGQPSAEATWWLAQQARAGLTDGEYPAAMYDFVWRQYQSGASWEAARDAVYQRYQVDQADGYDITSRELYCNGCFAAGINFAASLISWFYGEGDFKNTLKIAALSGWDSDNPAATWGGLLGFMLGREGIEKTFGRTFSERFNIHRTRRNFPADGIDNFNAMAQVGVSIVDRTVRELMASEPEQNRWVIPKPILHSNEL
ncbi:ADP-ribosylglycohydrolase family protein [Gilvimarinus polysaccharolyticus]|uniref:ADP-ribosylglycohydrolase family protein n=1 Tax=Gilvimarinus polysaccharolyticus TaxID=863921 RepID=UPI000673392C|nr:ADP-ribosylglycohydrolase family protein [Gilvimarinus polysaccharolyticus]